MERTAISTENPLAGAGCAVAERIGSAVAYLYSPAAQRLLKKAEDAVVRYPAQSLLIAGAVGLILGGFLRRQ